MAERWIFTKEQLQNTPSRKGGIDYAKELAYRQQAANLIQDMGQRLQVNQLCINTAIVYMHRFYMFQSFHRFHRNVIAPACLFLAAKVEEQLRKLEHVIKVARTCLNRDAPPLDTKSEAYLEQAQELVVNENILLQSLGFDIQVDHPHTHVVKTCQLVRASKDLAQTSYFLATNSLHLTTMCLQYKPTIVACVCIHLASKWSEYEIAVSHEGKQWYSYVDRTVTPELLQGLTQEFLNILDTCPLKLKRKILTWKSGNRGEEDGGPPPEKRHRGESSSSAGGSSSSFTPSNMSTVQDKHGGESSRSERKNESLSKLHRSETIPLSHTETSKHLQEEDPPPRRHTQSTPVRKSASETSVGSSKSLGQQIPSLPQSSSSADSLDGQKKVVDTQQKAMSIKDYKTYREHRDKQAAAAAAAAAQHEGERKPHAVSSGTESHRKHKHQHGSSSSGDEKKSRNREHERKYGHRMEESGRQTDDHLKVHIKKERPEDSFRSGRPSDDHLKVHIRKDRMDDANRRQSDDHLKVHIKKDRADDSGRSGRQSDDSLKVHIKKEKVEDSFKVHIRKESGTHKIKPTGSPLKLTIKTLQSESSPSKSQDMSSEHRPDSLKMKLSLKPGQASGHGERSSKHRRSESYSSHATGANPDAHGVQTSRHGYSASQSSASGVDGNGIHDPSHSNSRHSNSHHKGAEHQSRAGHDGKLQQSVGRQANLPNLAFTAERGASGSIFSPPPVHQNFEANIFNTGAMMLSQTASGSHRGSTNVSTAGYGGYPQQTNMSSNFSDSFPGFGPEMFLGDSGQAVHGLETNGGGMNPQTMTMHTKESLQQLQTNMQQLIGHTKSQIAQHRLQQQQHSQAAQYGIQGFMGMQGYQTNPPLPMVPPPPPPPPEDPPQPPPPPPSN
ncbi:cyclin-T2-like isoform X1 [Haliotis asinina]|uniref:cyclin-T2-like isoform X1 n=1 Tax=Haliotis asinina TaxID=109174 RepID=UPI0035320B25